MVFAFISTCYPLDGIHWRLPKGDYSKALLGQVYQAAKLNHPIMQVLYLAYDNRQPVNLDPVRIDII